jgi:cytochrome P450
VFGGGCHICPCHFFASNELELAMAHVLLRYDIRLAGGHKSKPVQMGLNKIVDPFVQFQVRREEVDIIL